MSRFSFAATAMVALLFIPLGLSSLNKQPVRLQSPFLQQEGCVENPPEGYTQEISGLVDGDPLTIRISNRFAGAVESMTWRDKEFINIYDHGRQISYAWSLDGFGECLNPTEPGTANDLFKQTSTSQLLSVCKTAENSLTAVNQPAYWLAPGQGGYCDGGTTGAKNETLLSNEQLTKSIQIGYEGLDNVIVFDSEIVLPEDHSLLQLEIPTGYLTYEFTDYWRYDPLSGDTWQPESLDLSEPWSFVSVDKIPPILATEDGQYAMGVYTTEDIAEYDILYFTDPPNSNTTNKWSIVLREEPAPAGTYTYRTFGIVGTLDEVRSTMDELFKLQPTDTHPPEGYFDVADCQKIEGWAWDPKSPDTPIDVELYAVDAEGQETLLGTVSAADYREDLVTALGDDGRHGFHVDTADLVTSGEALTLRAYGLNTFEGLPSHSLYNTYDIHCPELAREEPTATAAPTQANTAMPEATATTGGTTGISLPCIGGLLPLLFGVGFVWQGTRRIRR